jgi:kynurenine formamidase
MARIVEISHPITHGMATYPGLPRPVIGLHVDHGASRQRYDNKAEFAVGFVEMVGNTGTYVDSPLHRYPGGDDVSALPLERLIDLPTLVIDARHHASEGRQLELLLGDEDALGGRAVLIRTGWDSRWGTDAYWELGPFLSPRTVERLVRSQPALVGVDCWNVDDPNDLARPAHTQLLAAGVPIVEHLTGLSAVTGTARTFVVPLAVRAAPSLPVRAFALTPSSENAQ